MATELRRPPTTRNPWQFQRQPLSPGQRLALAHPEC